MINTFCAPKKKGNGLKQQTSLKNVDALFGFVQVMLLINDHLQQLEM